MRAIIGLFVILILVVGALYFLQDKRINLFPQRPTATPTTQPTTGGTGEISESENIRVTNPSPEETVGTQFTVEGEGRVFENVLQIRVKDAEGSVLAEAFTMTNATDVGMFGPFAMQFSLPESVSGKGSVEVFQHSAKDGSEIDMVQIPVTFQ